MPGIVRKLLICAAADGLILQPLGQRNQHTPNAVRVEYQTHVIAPLNAGTRAHSEGDSFEAFGIVGGFCDAQGDEAGPDCIVY